ncbi:MAG TPA: DUF4430 domain-containing protein [Candidatus Binatia bacterium]|nr:DUF4430 domain-containing protein [Candidatus Binatia bacterium]
MNYFKRLETIIILVIIVVLGVAYGALNNKAQAPATDTNTQAVQNEQETDSQQLAPAALVRYPGQDGRNAMELLKSLHRVETQSFGDMGEFVKSINGIEPDSTRFWAMYVNGSISQTGAEQYVTKSSDTIEWKLEEIK